MSTLLGISLVRGVEKSDGWRAARQLDGRPAITPPNQSQP